MIGTCLGRSQLISLYWSIGKQLLERQKIEKWGAKYLEQVSKDLSFEFPGMIGLSRSNLYNMRQFADEYHDNGIVQQAVGQLGGSKLMILIQLVKEKSSREWYAQQAIQEGWSRNVLSMMIKQDLYSHQKEAPKITNFKETLPAIQSDMAQELFKDQYNFEFLTIQKPAHERAIENALVNSDRPVAVCN